MKKAIAMVWLTKSLFIVVVWAAYLLNQIDGVMLFLLILLAIATVAGEYMILQVTKLQSQQLALLTQRLTQPEQTPPTP